MDASMHETNGPFSYRHNVHPPISGIADCYVWFKIKDHRDSEFAMCFDSPASILKLAEAATQAAADLQAKQDEFAPMKEWAQEEVLAGETVPTETGTSV